MSLFNFADTRIIQAIVWTIIHSLWQFTLIAMMMSILLKMYQNDKSPIRYYISLSSIIASFLVFVGTFCYFYYSGSNDSITEIYYSNISSIHNESTAYDWWNNLYQWIDLYQKPIYISWMVGVGIFLIRILGSMAYVEYLVRSIVPLNNQAASSSFDRVMEYYHITDRISIGESKFINSPMILGFIKPVILFPIGMINQLDVSETEAVLAHELAHFVRKDLYINIIQTLIEALLYYHPAIWWISTNIRVERENCCDEFAIGYMGDNIKYAKTLVKMQEIQHQGTMLALSFSQKNSFFSNRIKRILNMEQTRNFLKVKIITSFILILSALLFSKDLTGNNDKYDTTTKLNTEEKNIMVLIKKDSIPNKKESIRIEKKTNDKEIKISLENGNVTELEIDGKIIDQKDYDKYQDLIEQSKPIGNGNSRQWMFSDDDDDLHQRFEFKFNDEIGSDSLFERFGIKGLSGIAGFNFDQQKLNETLKQMEEHFGKMNFNFQGLDSLNFDFAFPQLDKLKNDPNFKLYEFNDDNNFKAPFGILPDNLPGFEESPDNKSFSDAIGNILNNDGLLLPGEKNKVELTGKYLKINGEKQPNNIYQKYRRIFEEESGTSLQKNSKLEFLFDGKVSKRKYKVY